MRDTGGALSTRCALTTTLYGSWEEPAAVWRFTLNCGVAEGFHNKVGCIIRKAYGFRNLENYRMHVKVLCS
jgi:transposase